MNSCRILIAGAGIGGLTAALCLIARGHEVRVFERASTLSEVGAGVQLGANASRVLIALGLEAALAPLVVRPERVDIRLFDTGEVLAQSILGAAHLAANGAPYWHVHRGDLHGVLVQAVEAAAPGAIRVSAGVTGFSESDAGVAVYLANGETVEGDLLIGADGIKSVVRNQILGPTEANWTGCVAWRGVIPVERLPAGYMDTVVTNMVGPHKHVVLYYLRGGKVLNLVGVVENDAWRDESWTVKAPWAELKADFAGWHPMVQQAIDALDPDECYRWALFNRLPVDNWSTGRATLLGDAAHAALPFMASGAAMAIEDGMILARCLEAEASVAEALQRYQRNRLERTARIQTQSTANGRLYHNPDAAALKAVFAGRSAWSGGENKGDWLAGYDAVAGALA